MIIKKPVMVVKPLEEVRAVIFISIINLDLYSSSASLSHTKKVPPPQPLLCHSISILPCAQVHQTSNKMAPYDSDSSDGEDSDYTLTNVLLGYTSKDAKEDAISHLGGSPVCLNILLF